MNTDPSGLRGLTHKPVRLTFRDGEVVDAIVLGVNTERDFDLTYEVLRVIQSAEPPALGSAPGASVIAELKDLVGWEPVD